MSRPDPWAQYAEKPADKWAQYAVKPAAVSELPPHPGIPAPPLPEVSRSDRYLGNASNLLDIVMNTAPGAETMGHFGSAETGFLGAAAPSALTSKAPLLEQVSNSPAAQLAKAGTVKIANKFVSPENMLSRANATRAAADAAPPMSSTVSLRHPLSVVRAANNATLPARASLKESVANWMGATAPLTSDADQFSAMTQASLPRTSLETPGKLGTPRPGVPQHIENQLQAAREAETPEDLYERVKRMREDQATAPRTDLLPTQSGGFPRPGPQPIPTLPPPEPVNPLTAIERGIAPSGIKAKLSTLRVTPKLAEEAPELAGQAHGQPFDSALMQAFKRTESGVMTAENAVGDATTVAKKPITDQWDALAKEYADRGLANSAAAVEKIAEKWKELPDDIPWDQFLKAKRAFFKEGANSAPLRRAYAPLMDATSGISEDLAKANKSYSTVRRALESAGIDLQTGRRIKSVGVTPKRPLP